MKKMSDEDNLSGKIHRRGSLFRKVFPVLLLLACVQMVMASRQQNAKFTVDFRQATLVKVFEYLETNGNVVFTYNSEELKNDPSRVTANFKDAGLDEVLRTCLEKSRFTYEKVGQHVVIKPRPQVKEHILKGKIYNEQGTPMPGVTIRLEGTSLGVASDVDGNFTMRIPVGQGTLIFTFIGYKDKRVSFKDDEPLNIKMEENIAALDEVQVVAYGEQKKRTLVSAISSVKADDIKELPTHSLESLLQGHMAGVEVNNISGSPGGGGSVVAIRGYNSFFTQGEGQDRSYGTPLYVIDGVPVHAFTSPVTGANTLSDLDPSMIESIEVLKDAASAAIYGSRAGNGVILITTKKGRAGKARFTANASYSASWLPVTPVQTGGHAERLYHLNILRNAANPYYDPATGQWKMTSSNEEVYRWPTENGPYFNYFWGRLSNQNAYVLQDSLNPFYNNSTNWWKDVYKVAKVWNANIQASGGSESMQYMVGAGYYNEEGIMLGSGFKRVNVVSNLSAKPTNRMQLNSRLGLSYSDRSRGGASSKGGLAGQKIEGITADPTRKSSLLPGNEYVRKDFLDELNSVEEKNQSYSARYNLMLGYELVKNLQISVSGSVDYNQQNQNHFEPGTMDRSYHFSYSRGTITRSISLMNENLLNYSLSLQGKHNFKLLLGLSFMKDQSFLNAGSGSNGPSDHIRYVGDGWGNSSGLNFVDKAAIPVSAFWYNSSFSEERMCSYFGRFNYNYREKYMLEATLRRDGSSVFGENVRWATFPSVAAGWAFSEEPFMKKLYWLSFGKIRLSYGTSGQKFRQRYLAHGLWSPVSGTFEGNGAMLPDIKGGAINKNLTWEETDQWDVGLDLNFFDYRLNLVMDYYYRYTHKQLTKADLPGNIYYFDTQWQNALATSNQGIEVELQADILRETAVKWRLKVNGSRNWNRFEKSNDGYDMNGMVLKKPMYQIEAYKTQGFYNKQSEVPVFFLSDHTPQPLYSGLKNAIFFPGMRRIVDLNGDGKITIDDMYPAASPLPQFHGGIANEIRWKDFDLNIFFTYSLGRHILKVYEDRTMAGSSSAGALLTDAGKINSWTGPDSKNPEYPVQQYFAYNNSQYTGFYDCDIEKVHMLRLKQLTLGYNLSERICKRIGVGGVRMFVTGENVFLLTNYSGLDPEIVDIYKGVDRLDSYPLPRKFTVGLTLNF